MKKELIKVLMVEDDLAYTRFIQEILKEPLQLNFDLTHADRVKKALDHIDETDFDVVLLDLNLPDSTGFDTLKRIYEKAPSIPIIVLTGLAEEDVGITAVQKGAQDYLSKEEVNSLLLSRTVKYAIERKRSIEELEKSYQKYYNLSARLQFLREVERKAMASEIHDELGGIFTTLKLELSSSLNALQNDKEEISEIKDSLTILIDKGIEIVQRISVELRPHILDHFGLIPAIEWYVKEFQKRAKIRCTMNLIENNLNLDKDRATAVFRILQEALTNIARHARASKVLVEVKKDEDSLD
ncbi:MAG: response regulator, partial [Nitrospira sp.]|nr:response regulator [Nitrospira sp.]